MTHDVIVVGGGFAGVTAAREATVRGRSVLLLEARERLGGRTWSAEWEGMPIEYGGAWVHWHQPHTWSEITRAGLRVVLSDDAERAGWYVGGERREGTIAERDAIAERGWSRFVEGVREALPNPHDPLLAVDALARFDRLTIAERLAELALDEEERDVLRAELESLAHGPLEEAGAVSVLRWHALSGYSLALTQYTGGRVTLAAGTGALIGAIAAAAPFETPARHAGRSDPPRSGAGRGRDPRRRGARRPRRRRGRSAQRARLDRVRASALRAEAAGDRARPVVARAEDLRPGRAAPTCSRTRSGRAIRSATSTPSSCSATGRSC